MPVIALSHLRQTTVLVAAALLALPSSVAALECSALSPRECVTQGDCTLTGGDGAYSCRPAANRCEEGFLQVVVDDAASGGILPQDELAATCAAKPGCRFVPAGQCFCPPVESLICVCGGGTPPSCEPES